MLDSDWPSISEYIDLELPGTHLKDIPFNEHWFKTERFDGWSSSVIEKSEQTLAGIMFL